jgi:hypothetical protein
MKQMFLAKHDDDGHRDSDVDYEDDREDECIQESTPVDEEQGEEEVQKSRLFMLKYI